MCNVCFTDIVLYIHDCDFWTLLAQPVSLIVNGDGFKVSAYRVPSAFSLSIFYLLGYAQRIRHKLNKRMKSSPMYNKLQHYLIEHACLWIFLTLICVNWIRTENEERNEREEVVVMMCVVVNLVNHLNEKKPFRHLYIFKQMLENNFALFIWKNRITTDSKFEVYSTIIM